MSDETRMTLLHSSTNNLVEELLMWRGRAAELLDRIAELKNFINQLIEAGESEDSPMPAVWLELVNDWKERDQ